MYTGNTQNTVELLLIKKKLKIENYDYLQALSVSEGAKKHVERHEKSS